MRYFSTQAATVRTVRKVGFYPSYRVLDAITKQLEWVLELTPDQREAVKIHMNGSRRPDGKSLLDIFGIMPSEQKVITDLQNWWSVDTVEDFHQKAFVMTNLNRGRCVVIVADRTVVLDSIKFENDQQITAWMPAIEADIRSMV